MSRKTGVIILLGVVLIVLSCLFTFYMYISRSQENTDVSLITAKIMKKEVHVNASRDGYSSFGPLPSRARTYWFWLDNGESVEVSFEDYVKHEVGDYYTYEQSSP